MRFAENASSSGTVLPSSVEKTYCQVAGQGDAERAVLRLSGIVPVQAATV